LVHRACFSDVVLAGVGRTRRAGQFLGKAKVWYFDYDWRPATPFQVSRGRYAASPFSLFEDSPA
jgi:hypothetical protein